MTDSTTTRRSFLGAGALLAGGAFILPALPGIALAAPRPSSPVAPPLAADLAGILNRPASAVRMNLAVCHCTLCDDSRATPMHCAGCGFVGTPNVYPCGCGADWDDTLQYWHDVLAGRQEQVPASALIPPHKPASVRAIKRHIRRMQRDGRPAICTDGGCAHLSRLCPVCGLDEVTGADGSFADNEGSADAAKIIRDLRAALVSLGFVV